MQGGQRSGFLEIGGLTLHIHCRFPGPGALRHDIKDCYISLLHAWGRPVLGRPPQLLLRKSDLGELPVTKHGTGGLAGRGTLRSELVELVTRHYSCY